MAPATAATMTVVGVPAAKVKAISTLEVGACQGAGDGTKTDCEAPAWPGASTSNSADTKTLTACVGASTWISMCWSQSFSIGIVIGSVGVGTGAELPGAVVEPKY